MPVIYDSTEEEENFAEQFDIINYDKSVLEDIQTRKLCLIHKRLNKIPESRIYLAAAHTGSLMIYMVYGAFYIRKYPEKFMDMKRLSFRHAMWRGTKVAFVLGTYYLTIMYLLFKDLNLRKKSKIRENIEFELLERNSYLSKECREKALGQMLHFYGFQDDFIKSTLDQIDDNLQGKIDFKKFSV